LPILIWKEIKIQQLKSGLRLAFFILFTSYKAQLKK